MIEFYFLNRLFAEYRVVLATNFMLGSPKAGLRVSLCFLHSSPSKRGRLRVNATKMEHNTSAQDVLSKEV
jgi:hypothetical protein